MMVSMLNAPHVDAATASKPLSAGAWWTNAGTYSHQVSGTGDYSGNVRDDGTYTEKFEVVSSDTSKIMIRYTETDSWTCTATGQWATVCESNKGTDHYQTDYTIDVATLKVTAAYDATSPESANEEVGHVTWILLATGLNVGDTPLLWWSVPNSDGVTSTITNVPWKVEKLQTINVKGVDVTARVVTYAGESLGSYWWSSGDQELHTKGLTTASQLYDTVYGIYMGLTRTGNYAYSSSRGGWTEKYSSTNQITDTNLEFQFKPVQPAQVSITLGRPNANVPISLDGVPYASGQLPKVFTWDTGSTHTLRVDKMILGESGVRYVFIQWSDSSKDASRSITATQSSNLTATFKTQYELKVVSDFGDPQGSGWYDAGSTATISVTSPQPETGLFGSLGGKTTFQTWIGDSTESTTANIVMDGPKTVHAEWTTDNSMPYMILGGIGVAVVAVIILALLLTRRKKPPAQAYPPAYAPAPPPPPPAQATAPFCKNCGKPTTYIGQYQRYYCYNCKQYE